MKNALVYILLVATLLPILSPWGTIAYYHVNKDYIARVLCQNRDKPQLHCDGRCYLAKKLKAQEDRHDRETTERVQHSPVLQLFCQTNVPFQFSTPAVELPPIFLPDYLLKAYAAPCCGLLRPPRIA